MKPLAILSFWVFLIVDGALRQLPALMFMGNMNKCFSEKVEIICARPVSAIWAKRQTTELFLLEAALFLVLRPGGAAAYKAQNKVPLLRLVEYPVMFRLNSKQTSPRTIVRQIYRQADFLPLSVSKITHYLTNV